MATTVKECIINLSADVTEDLGLSSAMDDVIQHKIELSTILRSNTTPDAETIYHGTVALVAGALTLSLLALTDTKGGTIATTGKKVRLIVAVPTSTNANAIVMTEGSANGYELFGDGWKVSLTAGQYLYAYCDSDTPDVGATATNIDLTGTLTQSIELLIVFG